MIEIINIAYFYKLLDRYDKPVTSLGIFTDANPTIKPDSYDYQFLGISAGFQFNTYKILEQDEDALLSDKNPFAMVVLSVLTAIKAKKWDDESLLNLKIDLFKRLYNSQMDNRTMHSLATFLKFYVHFSKPESNLTNLTFKAAIQSIIENKTTMGIEEMVLNRAEQKSIKKGIEKGKVEEIKNLITKLGLTDEQAADIASVDVAFVTRVRKEIGL